MRIGKHSPTMLLSGESLLVRLFSWRLTAAVKIPLWVAGMMKAGARNDESWCKEWWKLVQGMSKVRSDSNIESLWYECWQLMRGMIKVRGMKDSGWNIESLWHECWQLMPGMLKVSGMRDSGWNNESLWHECWQLMPGMLKDMWGGATYFCGYDVILGYV